MCSWILVHPVVMLQPIQDIQLHGFSDANSSGVGAAVYAKRLEYSRYFEGFIEETESDLLKKRKVVTNI